MKPWLFAAAAPALLAATPYSVRLSVKQCRPLPAATLAALGKGWSVYGSYVQRCAVPGPDRKPALLVDIIRIDHAYRDDFFKDSRDIEIPAPVIRDLAGREIGTLGEQFPEEPPGKPRVTFVRWQGGMPREIKLYEAGESALAPHPLPSLIWDAAARRYRKGPCPIGAPTSPDGDC